MASRSVRDRRLLVRHRRDSSFTAQFRADGPLGPGGVEIRNCGASGADSTYCQDECGGYEGELAGVDNYKYRYYVTGKVGDLNALPSNPKPDSETLYFPYTIRCHRGATVSEYNSVSGSNGYTSAHTATAHPGYSSVKLPVQCLDGKSKNDYDWLNLGSTTGSGSGSGSGSGTTTTDSPTSGAAASAPRLAVLLAAATLFAWL
jgi:hypothetical protein